MGRSLVPVEDEGNDMLVWTMSPCLGARGTYVGREEVFFEVALVFFRDFGQMI